MVSLLIAYFTFITVGLTAGTLGVAWIHIEDTFALSLSYLGGLLLVQTGGRLLLSLYTGPIIARTGIARLLLAGSALSTIGSLGIALAPVWAMVLVAGTIAGMGGSMIISALNVFLATNYSSSRMNWLHACFGLGATLGPLLVTTVVIDLEVTWRWSYGLIAGVQALTLLLFLLTMRRWALHEPADTESADGHGGRKAELRETMRLPILWITLAMFFLGTGAEATAGQLSNSLFVDGRGIDAKTAGTWISIFWFSLTIGRVVAGFISDRIDHGQFMRVNLLGMLLGAVLMWTHFSDLSSFIGLGLIGFAVSPLAPTMLSDMPRRVGQRHAPNAIGLMFTSSGIGLAFCPWLGGVLAENISLEIIGPFLVVLAFGTFALHEMLLLRERQRAAIHAAV